MAHAYDLVTRKKTDLSILSNNPLVGGDGIERPASMSLTPHSSQKV
jgi:hypothetical protein